MRALGLTLVVLGLCGYGGTTLGFHVGSSSVSVSLSASRRAQGAKRGGSGGCLGGGLPGRSSDCSRSRDSSFRPARQQSPFSSSPSHLKMGLLDGLLQTKDDAVSSLSKRVLSGYLPRVEKINALESAIEGLSDAELRREAESIGDSLRSGKATEDEVLERTFAIVREAAWRVLGLRHYDVQIMGGMALQEGMLAEMATGEGKTLVATLPAFLNALSGKGGVFVVTANDYLARRDAETMGQVHTFLGLSVGLVQANSSPEERRAAYDCDITYVTNQELGFDFLRDHLAVSPEEVVQRKPLFYCIVDEADSILVDEARTPLIISKKVDAPGQKYATAAKISGVLEKGVHYNVNEKDQSIILTERGYSDCDRILGKNMFDPRDPWANFILNALKAKELLRKDKEYIVKGNEIVLVDAFSGRILDGRRYSDGLHQSIEAKEGISVSTQSKVTAQVTYQSLFRLFDRLSGMTGTAATEALEFASTYDLKTVTVPTALPVARRDYPDVVFRGRDAADRAMLAEVTRVAKDGRPVLVGTTSIEASERIAASLKENGIECEMLNAKPENVQRESEVVAQAGRLGSVTVATNMAGRGTDIILGGNAEMMSRIFLRDSILKVQGASGSDGSLAPDSFFPCELSSGTSAQIDAAVAAVKARGTPLTLEQINEAVAVAAGSGSVQVSDKVPLPAATVTSLRKALSSVKAEFTDSLKEERARVLDMGGLYVVGTSRHESRRIDNQLRGRAGRQGDPGATRFFLSLDDDIFRIFGGDKTKKILETFRVSEDMPIESKGVAETLDKVQQATEDYFAGIRRTVLEFDEVLNRQRGELYRRRREVLMGDDASIFELMGQLCRSTVDDILPGYTGKGSSGELDAQGLSAKIKQFFPTSDASQLTVEVLTAESKKSAQALASHLHGVVQDALQAKLKQLESVRPGLGWMTARFLLVTQYDTLWSDHLEAMNLLKENVSMAGFGGKNPLDEFKIQGGELFRGIFDTARLNAVYSFYIYQPNAAAS